MTEQDQERLDHAVRNLMSATLDLCELTLRDAGPILRLTPQYEQLELCRDKLSGMLDDLRGI